ncbi:hypothetical protein O6H91_Y057900 [Diphasiastrum complanatum]|nr:hypothetical protein O6H91_Y057900 [Diphasiastrum complanatum]
MLESRSSLQKLCGMQLALNARVESSLEVSPGAFANFNLRSSKALVNLRDWSVEGNFSGTLKTRAATFDGKRHFSPITTTRECLLGKVNTTHEWKLACELS